MLLTSGQGWGHWWSEGGCEHPWGRTTGRGQAGGTGTHGLLLRWKGTAQSKNSAFAPPLVIISVRVRAQ